MATIEVRAGDDLQVALNDASVGDTLRVHFGTFIHASQQRAGVPAGEMCVFNVPHSGLTLQAYGDGTPLLTYDPANPPWQTINSCYGAVLWWPRSIQNITIDGFEIVGMNALGSVVPVAENLCLGTEGDPGATIVRNCILRDGNFGIVDSGTGALYELNQIYNMGAANPDSRLHGIYADGANQTIRYNYIHHCTGYGIHGYSAPANLSIYANTVVHNGGGLLVTGDGHRLINNTIAWNDGGGIVANDGNRIGLIGYSTNTVVENNNLWGNGKQTGSRNYGDVQWDSTFSSATWRKNCYNTIGNSGSSQTSYDPSDKRDDPQFFVATPQSFYDFRIPQSSSCWHTGLAQSAPYNVGLDGRKSSGWPPALLAW